MTGAVKHIENDGQYQPELTNAGSKLVVVDFSAAWCGPCKRIEPVFEQFASKYSKAVFLKVDVDKCPTTAASNSVSAMPTFIFFKQSQKLDSLRGADQNALEDMIKKWYGSGEDTDSESGVKGYIDLSSMIQKNGCECLNESDEHPLSHALNPKGGYLESDCDEQLIIALEFNQKVKLHSLRIDAPADKGPKTLKLFINQPQTLDFDKAMDREPVQTLELTPEDLETGSLVNLKLVKLQHVENVNLFVKDNQEGGEVTQIDHITFIGQTTMTTSMSDFKRIAGKKGESH